MNMVLSRRNSCGKAIAWAVLVGFTAVAHARAHAFLDRTDPVVGSTNRQGPSEVRLWYTQGLEPAFSRVQVFDATGNEVDKKDVHLDPKNNHLLVVSLPAGLGAGTYKVVWRVVSVDTHPTEGAFTFRVAPCPWSLPMAAMPFPWARWLCQGTQTGAAVLLAGATALRLLARDTGVVQPSGWCRLAWTSWGVLLGAALLQLGLTAADMSGLPLARACSGPVLASVLASTLFGAVWKVRLGLLAALLIIGATPREGGRTWVTAILEVAAPLLTTALLTTLVWSGHAQASDKRAWLLPVDALHAVAAGVWPGGLLPFALLLARAHRDSRLVPSALKVARRFSCLSVAAVSILAISGLLNTLGLVGTLSALWSGVYGRLILCKVTLLAGMVGLGAVNRRMIRHDGPGSAAQTLRMLWRNVTWETVLAVAVLLATAALALSAPPASEGAAAPMPTTFSLLPRFRW